MLSGATAAIAGYWTSPAGSRASQLRAAAAYRRRPRDAHDGTTTREPETSSSRALVTAADKGTYQEHPFDVPAGRHADRRRVQRTTNKGAGTELEIGLFDPQRFRGTSRFSKARFHISEFEATPSYVPGPLVAGHVAALARHSGDGAGHDVGRGARRFACRPRRHRAKGLAATLEGGAAWYVGDLHAHTLHSDGFGCKDPDAPRRRAAVSRGRSSRRRARAALDFLAITDHNTTTHHADLATLQEGLDVAAAPARAGTDDVPRSRQRLRHEPRRSISASGSTAARWSTS